MPFVRKEFLDHSFHTWFEKNPEEMKIELKIRMSKAFLYIAYKNIIFSKHLSQILCFPKCHQDISLMQLTRIMTLMSNILEREMGSFTEFKIVEMSVSDKPEWKIKTERLFSKYFQIHESEFKLKIDTLIKYVSQNPLREDFKWFIEVNTMQFFVGVFTSSKEIYIGSKNLSDELVVLSLNRDEVQLENQDYTSFVKRLATIPLENTPTVIEFLSHVEDLPLFNEGRFESVHEKTNKLTQKLAKKVSTYKSSLFERFSDYGLSLTANYMLIRIHMLKFLAILPNLDHDTKGEEVKRIFLETLRRLHIDSTKARVLDLT